MATFDSNKWYLITVGSLANSAYKSTPLYSSDGKGAVFFESIPYYGADSTHFWQIIPVGDAFILRSSEAGPRAYLSLSTQPGSVQGDTSNRFTDPVMLKSSNVQANENYWHIESWGDGSYFFYNAVNGSSLHLQENGASATEMSAAKAKAQQKFSFVTAGPAINNAQYSTIELGSTTSIIANPTGTSLPASNSANTTPASQSTGVPDPNDSATTIIIAAALGGAIIALVGIIFLLVWRRARRRAAANAKEKDCETNTLIKPSELPGSLDRVSVYELSEPVPELDAVHLRNSKIILHGLLSRPIPSGREIPNSATPGNSG